MNLFIVIMPIIHNYCITNKYFQFLDDLNINVILAGSSFKNLEEYPKDWIKDNQGTNISNKNKILVHCHHISGFGKCFQNLSKDTGLASVTTEDIGLKILMKILTYIIYQIIF